VSWAWLSRGFALILSLLALGCGRSVLAHQINLSSAEVSVGGDRHVAVAIGLKGSDVDRVAGTHIYDPETNAVRPQAVSAASNTIGDYIASHVAVATKDGRACPNSRPNVVPDGDGVSVQLTFDCSSVPGLLLYRSTVLNDVDPGARQVAMIREGTKQSQALLDRRDNTVELAANAAPSLLHVIGSYLEAGVEHIFLGYDHIAFLLAVVLWARRLWPVVKIVTSFTIAHSVTLSLAALNIVRIPAAIVEPAIAASIVFVAVENFLSRDVERRWRITFLFGFIHGFGFADALQEMGLPHAALVPALAAFNIGVELGQIGIVSIILPILFGLDRLMPVKGRAAPAVYLLSGVIVALGCWWFLARTILA
jgi:hydrogenase/urease accessory protein HupE